MGPAGRQGGRRRGRERAERGAGRVRGSWAARMGRVSASRGAGPDAGEGEEVGQRWERVSWAERAGARRWAAVRAARKGVKRKRGSGPIGLGWATLVGLLWVFFPFHFSILFLI